MNSDERSFWSDHSRMQAALEADMAFVEAMDEYAPNWREDERDDLYLSRYDFPAEQVADIA